MHPKLTSQGNLILGPDGTTPSRAKFQGTPDVDDTTGIVFHAKPSPAVSNERAGLKVGDFSLVQDSAQNGAKDLAVLDADGVKIATLYSSDVTQGTSRKETLFKSTLPLIVLPTGSVADDGALTSGTANTLNATYGSYCWFPAAALWAQDLVGPPIVAADSPAGWYYVEWSGADTGTIYRDTWDGASDPVAPTAPLAIVSTTHGAGPGAFVGPTAEAAYISIPMPASLVGDIVTMTIDGVTTDNANIKAITLGLNGSSLQDCTLTSLGLATITSRIIETAADVQLLSANFRGDAATSVIAPSIETETTSVAWTLEVYVSKAVATDVVGFLSIQVERDRR